MEPEQVIERPAGEVRLDEALVDLPRRAHRVRHGVLRHLGERDPPDVLSVGTHDAPLLEQVQHVPRDGLAFPVRIGREQELDRGIIPQGLLQGVYMLLRVLQCLPLHRKSVFWVDRPGFRGQVADVAIAREDPAAVEEFLYLLGLGLRTGEGTCGVRERGSERASERGSVAERPTGDSTSTIGDDEKAEVELANVRFTSWPRVHDSS